MTDPFNILAAEYRPMVLAYLRAMVADAHLAEDLTQETMIAAHKSIDGFEAGENFGQWLRGIARNKALMHWRSEKRHPLLVDSRVIDGINEVFDSLDRNAGESNWWESRKLALRDCVSLLSGHLKAAVDSVYFGGNSLDESAASLNSSRAAVGQRLSRARNQIRECMDRKLQLLDDHV
jgi:RNA polymerase sigma-70 factor (ECF subfamily)